jgi:hypothetical protein
MSFFSRGSGGRGNRERGRRPNELWGNKRLHLSIHFDVEYEEFNQLLQTSFLNLADKGIFNLVLHLKYHPFILSQVFLVFLYNHMFYYLLRFQPMMVGMKL